MMQLHLCAYGREGEPCPRCGFPMNKIFVNNRGTTYCPICQKNPNAPFVLGVTGPIHSGKSTVSRYFESKGYTRFDADVVAKNAYLDTTIKKQVIHLLGRNSYQAKNVNIPFVRSAIIADPSLKEKLEEIIHPYVFEQAKKLIAKQRPNDKVVLDVPLLFPAEFDVLCDATILVVSSISMRQERLAVEGKDVSKMIELNRRYPLAMAEKKARFIIQNDGDLRALYDKLDGIDGL